MAQPPPVEDGYVLPSPRRCKVLLMEHLVLALGPEKQSSGFVGHCGGGAPTTLIALPTTIISALSFDTQVLPAAFCMPVQNKCKPEHSSRASPLSSLWSASIHNTCFLSSTPIHFTGAFEAYCNLLATCCIPGQSHNTLSEA